MALPMSSMDTAGLDLPNMPFNVWTHATPALFQIAASSNWMRLRYDALGDARNRFHVACQRRSNTTL